MKRNKLKANVFISKLFLFLALFLFIVFAFRITQLTLTDNIVIAGKSIKEYSASLITVEKELKATRGSIFDANGNPLAQNVASYTLIAYLNKDREKEDYVQNKEETAKLLAPFINMEEEGILTLLNRDSYQVEFGPGGRNLSQSIKDEIEKLNIKGIDFIKNTRRYYPNGNYASYIIGYSKTNEEGIETGEMGIEKSFNDYLTGENGYVKYQAYKGNIKIANTKEEKQDEVDGNDVHLTIDTNIQLFVEQATKKIFDDSKPEWAVVVVADAKTGAILGTSSVPSFDPNHRDITNYLNPLNTIVYEPGSTMKIFTYMAALENGTYDGEETYDSGTIKIGEDTIKDWNNKGWGKINFDKGFALSSNVGVSTMLERDIINRKILRDYFLKLGFGKITGIELPSEAKGRVEFRYKIEIASAAFGQGITTTAIQNIQALTAISNNGIMLKPYVVEKVVNKNNEIIYQGGREEIGRVAKETTIKKIKELMKDVMDSTPETGTGSRYYIPQYEMIGKTGTAQIFDSKLGRYLTGDSNYTRVFSGLFPKDNPQVIVYAAVKKGYSVPISLSKAVKNITESVGKYLNIKQDQTNSFENISYQLPSYINKNTNEVVKQLKAYNINPIIIGDGDKIINQYPNKNTVVTYLNKVILKTNSTQIKIPSFKGWSRQDFIAFVNLTNINYEIEGFGYIKDQNYKKDYILKENDIVIVNLESLID